MQHYITVSAPGKKGAPEGISVKYVVYGDEIVLYVTAEDYKKYPTELDDTEVACVVSADRKTLQFVASSRLTPEKNTEKIKQTILTDDPDSRYYFTSSTRFFELTPTLMRFQDYGKRPVENAFYEPEI